MLYQHFIKIHYLVEILEKNQCKKEKTKSLASQTNEQSACWAQGWTFQKKSWYHLKMWGKQMHSGLLLSSDMAARGLLSADYSADGELVHFCTLSLCYLGGKTDDHHKHWHRTLRFVGWALELWSIKCLEKG